MLMLLLYSNTLSTYLFATLTADNIEEPFASSAAIHDANVQPVPCVFRVCIRDERNS